MAKVKRAKNFRWAGVPEKVYKTDGTGFKDITRQTLLGEESDEQALNFLTRYFEIQPGGYSSLENHDHPHTVVVIRGRGEVVLENRVEPIGLHDCVYVSPGAYHQFHATGKEALGFLCIVDRERDRPHLPGESELERLRENADVSRRIKT